MDNSLENTVDVLIVDQDCSPALVDDKRRLCSGDSILEQSLRPRAALL